MQLQGMTILLRYRFPEFKDPTDIKLFIYKFHDYFDGLIGLDLLERTLNYTSCQKSHTNVRLQEKICTI